MLLSRAVLPSEILRVKALPQVVGWRYRPRANGTPPCACICCEKGTYGIRKLVRRVEEAEAAGRPTKIVVFSRGERSYRRVERLAGNASPPDVSVAVRNRRAFFIPNPMKGCALRMGWRPAGRRSFGRRRRMA